MNDVGKLYLNDDQDLSDCSFGEIYSKVMAYPGSAFGLTLQRVNVLESGVPDQQLNQQIMRDYAAAAWIGQRLYEQCASFYYWVPNPSCNEPFKFEIEITNKELFADTLFDIISEYINPGAAQKRENYETRALLNFLQAWNCKVEAICWGLIHITYDLFKRCKDFSNNTGAATTVV